MRCVASWGDLAADVLDVLHAAFEAVIRGEVPPARMRVAFLAMLPKGTPTGAACRRQASATRPIALANTWENMAMAAINRPMLRFAERRPHRI